MQKEFIPYEQALELKELGFDETCMSSRDMNNENGLIQLPLYQQAFRWFRKKYQLHSYIEGAYPWYRYYINSKDDRWEGHKTLVYEEAELACLKKLIEIVKNKKD